MSKAADDIVRETERLAGDVAARHGLEVVEVRFNRHGSHGFLRVDVDRPGTPGVGLADCELVSRELELLLDEADLIPGSYDLQVSSPGLDRPIRTDDDVRRNTGRFVVVETSQPVAGLGDLQGEHPVPPAHLIEQRHPGRHLLRRGRREEEEHRGAGPHDVRLPRPLGQTGLQPAQARAEGFDLGLELGHLLARVVDRVMGPGDPGGELVEVPLEVTEPVSPGVDPLPGLLELQAGLLEIRVHGGRRRPDGPEQRHEGEPGHEPAGPPQVGPHGFYIGHPPG